MALPHLPRLDGIRALAVSGVLLTHFFWPIFGEAQLGRIGVRTFFVLSGFLITRILLDYRSRMAASVAARNFYWRRFLRLAPPYYFAIAVSLILGIANMRADWLWHVFYLSNVLSEIRGGGAGEITHLWSLSVEEQFYLVWFVVAVWLPRRYLLPVILSAILLAPVFRFLAVELTGRPTSYPPSVMDSLAMGALIGWASLNNQQVFRAFGNWWTFTISGAAMALVVASNASPVLSWTILSVWGASLIALAATPGTRGLNWLSLAPLQDLGKISYGVYLYHKFVPLLLDHFGLAIPNPLTRGLVYTFLSVAVAATSWKLIENPAMLFKNRPPRGNWTRLLQPKHVDPAADDVRARENSQP